VVTPGTGALYTISAGLAREGGPASLRRSAARSGSCPNLAAAITGTAALLRASSVAFETVKFSGRLPVVPGLATWRERALSWSRSAISAISRASDHVSGASHLLNPKLTIFFFAFLPQFVPENVPARW